MVLAAQGSLRRIFQTAKDSFPPRINRLPWTASGGSENLPMKREGGKCKAKPGSASGFPLPPLAGSERQTPVLRDQSIGYTFV
jgi:hypothetical protein